MRVEKTLKNTQYAMLSQLLSLVISFVNRTIFIRVLSLDYLGINGLFGNILSILSLAELGVGSAITYNMYKPLAVSDISKVRKLMNFYRTMYTAIGLFILVSGLCLLPFLNFFIKDTPNIENLALIYALYVFNSAVSYLFTYKRSIIFADQKNYIDSVNRGQQAIVQSILQNTILILTGNYILYFVVQIFVIIVFNILISSKANRMYPYLKHNNERLDKKEKQKLFKDVSALLLHRIGYVAVCSTDNFLISKFIGLAAVGLYSNYIMILTAVKGVLIQFITGITASVGNLNAIEAKEKTYEVYKKLYFLNAWIIGFCSIAFYILFNPFIELWLGEEYLLKPSVVLIIAINFYICDIRGIRSVTNTFKDSMGLFWQDRFKPIFEAVINLVASIILLKIFGLLGVLLGTLISTISTNIWVEPYIVYKYGFQKKLKEFFLLFFRYILVTIVAGLITTYLSSLLHGPLVIRFVVAIILVMIIPNLLFVIAFCRTDEFNYYLNLVRNKLRVISNILNNPVKLIYGLERKGLLDWISDERYLRIIYKLTFKRKLNLKSPQAFTEKLAWYKLHWRNKTAKNCTDKLKVRDYVASKIGTKYIIEYYGCWDSFDEIDFNSLPEQFVLKTTNGSGDCVICKDKRLLDMDAARKKLSMYSRRHFSTKTKEWAYYNLPYRIIAERYIKSEDNTGIKDYKFFCFDGKPQFLLVGSDRETNVKFSYYDMDWSYIPLRCGHDSQPNMKKPDHFDEMVNIAAKLSEDFPHVRVDLYDEEGRVYFGELTFYHYGGIERFEPDDWDFKLGKYFNLAGISSEQII